MTTGKERNKSEFKPGDKVSIIGAYYGETRKGVITTEVYPGEDNIEVVGVKYRKPMDFTYTREVVKVNKVFKEGDSMKLSKPAITTGIVLLVVALFAMVFVGNYNGLVSSRAAVDNSWSKVETQYQRRLDLIDNLVESVKGSQLQEQKVFGDIANARKQYSEAKGPEEQARAASSLETNIALIPRLQEAYPELKSNQNVQALMGQLTGTEDGIAKARNDYNDTTTNYNVQIQRFPKNIYAGLFNFEARTLFKSASGAEKAPKVKF